MKRLASLVASLALSANATAADPAPPPVAPVKVETVPLPSPGPDDCAADCGTAACIPTATCAPKRPRIVVHQAAPIVEVRQASDTHFRLCGGWGGLGHGGGCSNCGGGSGGGSGGASTVINKYKHNCFGSSAAPAQTTYQAPVALQAAPMMYAVAPMAMPVQQMAVAAMPQMTVAAAPQFVATQQYAVAPAPMAVQAAAPLAVAPASTGISMAEFRALAQLLNEGQSSGAAAANFKAASVDDVKGLDGRVKSLEDRVARIERKLSALCETP